MSKPIDSAVFVRRMCDMPKKCATAAVIYCHTCGLWFCAYHDTTTHFLGAGNAPYHERDVVTVTSIDRGK